MSFWTKFGGVMLAVALSLTGGDRSARAADFYEGKTLEIIVPLAAGGQLDIAARVLANYMTRFVDGNPKVQVVNLTGGGGVLGANQFELNRKHDGMHFLFTGTATVLDWILGRSVVKYDFKRIHPLWAAPNPSIAYFPKNTGIKTVADLLHPAVPLVSATVAPTAPELPTYTMLEVAGLLDKVRVVQGYQNGNEVTAAFMSGEANFGRNSHGAFDERYGKMLADGDIAVVYTYGFYDDAGNYIADPKRPNLPNLDGAVTTLLGGKKPTGELWQATLLLNRINVIAADYLGMHLDAPAEAKAAMDKGMLRIVADPGFKADMGRIFGVEYPTLSGPGLMKAHQAMTNADPALVKVMQKFLVDKFKYKFD